MKSLNKLLLVSAVLSAALSQMLAYKVVDEDGKMVDIYGSARGYVGVGSSTTQSDTKVGTIYGLQSNSRLGVKAQVGNITVNTELGLKEDDTFRQIWGSYTFGSAGTLLLGKTDAPSVAKSIFNSDLAATEQGSVGFGGLRTSSRKFQIAYSVAGLTIALVDDNKTVVDTRGAYNEVIPRIAASYYYQNEEKTLDFQIGGAYKYYNRDARGFTSDDSLNNSPTDSNSNKPISNAGDRFGGKSGSAFHIFTAVKAQMLDKKLYISGQLHYGVNADLYGEQRTHKNEGGFNHTQIFNKEKDADVQRMGVYVESGYKISDTISTVLGGGYQYSSVSGQPSTANTYMVMAQLPVKLEKSFTITPQIGYYGASTKAKIGSPNTQDGLLAFVRLRYDF